MRIPSFVFTAALLLSGAGANAEEYPSKPIRVIVPYAAGSTGEAAFRIIANDIEARLPQRFVVESRAGAAGNLGAGFVAAAEPDGYTLLLGATNNFTINQHLYPNIGFDPLTAFAPIGVLVDLPFVAYASAALPATTLQEVATLAKQKPNSMNYASSGIGSPMQLGGVLFSQIAGIEMTHVPFRSNAQSTTALLGNEVQFYVGLIAGAPELADTGKLRILATAGPERSPALPNIPSAAEAGFPTFKISNWWALAAPRGTPSAVIDTLSREFRKSLSNPGVKERLLKIGMVPIGNTPAEFGEQIRRESAVWSGVIKSANITLN